MGRHTNARRCVVDGIKFDSRAEAARYAELAALKKTGRVTELEVHPHFDLRGANGGLAGRGYTADFAYRLDGTRTIVEDVKGRRFRDWPLRRDLFADNYRSYEFYEVRVVRGHFEAKRILPREG